MNIIGQSIGRYHILEQLGEGGMAVVYKAFDTRLERNVAIKVILPGKQHSEKFLKRFEREAKALAGLSHPNIVKVIDYGEQDGLPYLVMEYIPGGTLKHMLGKAMPWQEAARLLLPVSRALAYAHENKIVHRDVKPSNILITQSGEPMLSDFGIAKMLEAEETLDLTGTGVGLGTPEYMSPEQAQGNQVDARSDVYSLGVVLYEMVTGRKPYQADTPYAVVIKHVNEPLPRPKSFASDLPESGEHLLLKALSKSPADRFQDMHAFAKALENTPSDAKAHTSKPSHAVNRRLYWGVAWLILVGLLAFSYWTLTIRASNTQMPQPTVPAASEVPTSVNQPFANSSDTLCKDTPGVSETKTDFSFTTLKPYDDFNESVYDESFNRSKWDFAPGTAVQSKGYLSLKSQGSGVRGDLPLFARNAISAKLCIPEFHGNDFSVLLKFLPSFDYYWHYTCTLTASKDGSGFSCSAMDQRISNTDSIYDAGNIPIQKGQWYRVDMEVDPKTSTIRSYLDGQLVDVYSPENAQEIIRTKTAFTVDTWAGDASSGVALVDDVQVGTPVNTQVNAASTPEEYTYLAMEDFEDGKIQIEGFSTDSNRWKLVDDETGNKVFQVDNREGQDYPSFAFGTDDWTDYSTEYRVKYLSGKESVGLQVRSNAATSYYIVDLDPEELYLAYAEPAGWKRITTKFPPIQLNKWYTVKVIVQGDRIQVLIDDARWIDEHDARGQRGGILFFGSPSTYAEIDDLKVIELK